MIRRSTTSGMARWVVFGLCVLGFRLLPIPASGLEETRNLVNPRDIPVMSGIAECELADTSKPIVRLIRTAQPFLMAAPWRFPLFPRDILDNLSRDAVRLENVRDEATYAMEPGSRLEFQPRGVIPASGTIHMEFKRVNGVFRILLPAVARVRGEARLDVTIRPDSTSELLLLSGKIGIVGSGGVELAMEAGQKALMSPRRGETIRILPGGEVGASGELRPGSDVGRDASTNIP